MQGSRDDLRGALAMMASMGLFVLSDACLKALAGQADTYQVAFWRGCGITGLFLLAAWRTGAFRAAIPRALWGAMVTRGAAEAFVAWCYITALFTLPLANATAILQATPLAMTAVGALLLGERVGPRRWGAVLLGLAGVLVIVRPGTEGFDANSAWALGAVAGVVLRDIATRRIPRSVPTVAVTTVTAACVTLFGAAFGGWRAPEMAAQGWGILAASGGLVALAYMASVGAMRFGDASFTAPFRYVAVPGAGLVGWAVFGERPDGWEVIGALIVVAAGLYALRRQAAPRAPLARRGSGP